MIGERDGWSLRQYKGAAGRKTRTVYDVLHRPEKEIRAELR